MARREALGDHAPKGHEPRAPEPRTFSDSYEGAVGARRRVTESDGQVCELGVGVGVGISVRVYLLTRRRGQWVRVGA